MTMIPAPVHLDAAEFQIDMTYQRDPKDRLTYLKKIASAFDPQKFGVIHISKRADGSYWIVDGAGRCHVVYVLLESRATVPCIIHRNLTVAEEARLFVDLQLNRKNIGQGDMFKALVRAGEPQALAINTVVERMGMTVGRRTSPANIGSVHTAATLYQMDGTGDILARSLAIKKAVWPDIVVTGGLIEAIGLFLKAVPGLDEAGLRQVLEQNPPVITETEVKVRHGGKAPLKRHAAEAAAVFWADKYNGRRRNNRADPGRIIAVSKMTPHNPIMERPQAKR